MNDTLASYFVILRRWWQVVAAMVLFSLLAASCLVIFKPVQYESTAVLFVSTPRDDAYTGYRGDMYAKERLGSYATLGSSADIAARVIRDVRLDISPAELVKRTVLAPIEGTVLLLVTTTADSPAEAQAVTTAYTAELRRSIAALETVPGALVPRTETIVVQPATFDTSAAGFPAWLILGAATGLGLIIGCAVAVIISLLDGRIRRAVDSAEATGYPVLAEFASTIVWPSDDADPAASESGRKLRTALDRLRMTGTQVVLITSAESGAGKTGTALTVCRALADRGSTVTLVDFDSRGSTLANRLELEGEVTLAELITESEITDLTATTTGRRRSAESTIAHYARNPGSWNGVSIIPFGPAEANPGSTADDPRLTQVFAALRNRCDWVIVDTPAAADYSEATRLAQHSDAVFLIARAGRTKFDELRRVTDDLDHADGHVAGVIFIDDRHSVGPVNNGPRESDTSTSHSGVSEAPKHATPDTKQPRG